MLEGLTGDDTLYGGAGADAMHGGDGEDGYVYALGDGDDTLADSGGEGETDTLVLTGGIGPGDVAVHRLAATPDDLVLTFAQGGRVVLTGFMASPGAGIDAVAFDDGTVWSRAELQQKADAAPLLDNELPQAVDDPYLVAFGPEAVIQASALLANDRDFEGDPLTIVAVGAATVGSVTLESRRQPAPDHAGRLRRAHLVRLHGRRRPRRPSPRRGGGGDRRQPRAPARPRASRTSPRRRTRRGASPFPPGIFDDADGDRLVFGASLADGTALPAWLAFDAATTTFSGTPPADFNGPVDLRVTASDGAASASAGFRLLVTPTNDAPRAAADGGLVAHEGTPLVIAAATLLANDIDADGDSLSLLTVASGPAAAWPSTPPATWCSRRRRARWGRRASPTRSATARGDGRGHGQRHRRGFGWRTLTGTAADDVLAGTPAADVIEGGGGNDQLSGGGGDDTFKVLGGETGFDIVDGGAGLDRIAGSPWNDVIGIAGLSGVEFIEAGTGSDTIRLTDGNDTLDLAGVAVTGVELIDAGAGNDTVAGSATADTISGGAGDDLLAGGDGDDVFNVLGGAEGFDLVQGGAGLDRIQASPWNDVIGLANLAGNLADIEAIDGGAGSDTLRLTSGNDTLDLTGIAVTGVELIEAGAGNDTVTGSAAADAISGGAGDDLLAGGAGDDVFNVLGGAEASTSSSAAGGSTVSRRARGTT